MTTDQRVSLELAIEANRRQVMAHHHGPQKVSILLKSSKDLVTSQLCENDAGGLVHYPVRQMETGSEGTAGHTHVVRAPRRRRAPAIQCRLDQSTGDPPGRLRR